MILITGLEKIRKFFQATGVNAQSKLNIAQGGWYESGYLLCCLLMYQMEKDRRHALLLERSV